MRHLPKIFAAALLLSGTSALAQDAGQAGGPNAMPGQQAHDLLESHSGGPLTNEAYHGYADEAFTGYDSDQDGYLSNEEWSARNRTYFETRYGTDGPYGYNSYGSTTLNAYDADGDGRISEQEWNTRGETYYGAMDADGDGYLDQDEWMTGNQVTAESYDRSTLGAYDTDNDGQVSQAEWNTQVDSYYGEVDLDGSGTIEQDELDAARTR